MVAVSPVRDSMVGEILAADVKVKALFWEIFADKIPASTPDLILPRDDPFLRVGRCL